MTLPPPPRLPSRAPSPGLRELRRRALTHPERPGKLLRRRAPRLVHPYCRRARPSDTGG